MFERVLFATTGSPACDNAAKVAFDLARVHEAHLMMFHVLGLPSHGYSQLVRDVRTGEEEEVSEDYRQWVEEELKNTYELQMQSYGNWSIQLATGRPSREILRAARSNNADIVVLGAHTKDEDVAITKYRAVAGNTLRKVAKSSRTPVLIVNRPCDTCWSYFSNIVVGVDMSKASEYAFQFAYKTARDVGCRLHVFHAADLSSMYAGKEIGQEEIEKKIDEAKRKIKYHYISQMEDYDNYDVEVWEGIPYVEILKFARAKEADLIVMAHHARDVDPEQADLGSTVEQVVLRAACPVASVNHPDKVVDM